MKCKHHPERMAEHLCASCNIPICRDCAEEIRPGVYMCFQCAMLQSVTEVGTGLKEKRKKAKEKAKKEKKWGPFHYFLTVSSVLILVMWGVIIFGGQESPAGGGVVLERGKADRVVLFMVDAALKRYAHYKGNVYPDTLLDLVPKYLNLKEDQTRALNRLSYVKYADPKVGYELSLTHVPPGEMKIILTPGGLKYTKPVSEEAS